jgi:hypothetical protein
MSDLFSEQHKHDLQRLRDLSWRELQAYGRGYWEHPQTRAWYTEEQALEWLRRRDERLGEATP